MELVANKRQIQRLQHTNVDYEEFAIQRLLLAWMDFGAIYKMFFF